MPEALEVKRQRYQANKGKVKPAEFRNHLALAMLAPSRRWTLKLSAGKLQAYEGTTVVATAYVSPDNTWRYE